MKGCGDSIAFQLALSPFGDQLLHAAREKTHKELRRFLVHWRTELQHELRTNESQFLSSRHPLIAQKVSNSFLKLEVLQAYINPLVLPFPLVASHVVHDLCYCAVNVRWLVTLCDSYFKWGE